MNLHVKVPGTILPLGCGFLSTGVKTLLGVGVVATPSRKIRVKGLVPRHIKNAEFLHRIFLEGQNFVQLIDSLKIKKSFMKISLIRK